MDLILKLLSDEDKDHFMEEMENAFQKGTEDVFGNIGKKVLPEEDIKSSLQKYGAAAYEAIHNGRIVGGAIVVIDEINRRNHLDLFFVSNGMQGKGIGKTIWERIEQLYPDTEVWETVTPYFEKRNIHFYINVCGFSAVEFFNPYHRDLSIPSDMIGGDYFFRFEKRFLKRNENEGMK